MAKAYGVAYDQFLPAANLITAALAEAFGVCHRQVGVVRHLDIQDHPKSAGFRRLKAVLKDLAEQGKRFRLRRPLLIFKPWQAG